jgi:hypothetical protein
MLEWAKRGLKGLYIILFLFILALLSACNPRLLSDVVIQRKSISITDKQVLIIQVNSGEINILKGGGSFLEISGTTNLQDESVYQVEQNENEVRIIAENKPRLFSFSGQPNLKFTIQVPPKHKIKIITFDARVNLYNYAGDLDVSAVSGTISARNFSGTASLKSNRGDITVSDSNGELYILGNYGVLSLENLKGIVNSSTIMGTIKFTGLINSGDGVHLETDHGPVEVLLLPGSNQAVQIRSTSGNATCRLPDLSVSPRNCDGIIGNGSGRLSVRTVSGDVTLQQEP